MHRAVVIEKPESGAPTTRTLCYIPNKGLKAGHGSGTEVYRLRGKRGLAQPAVKCRGPGYLRIIYGPDYDAPDNLSRLRSRGLAHKRVLALGEFALGVEGLERFDRRGRRWPSGTAGTGTTSTTPTRRPRARSCCCGRPASST